MKKFNATSVIVATLGVIFAISGIGHGIFEILQGNTTTNGLMINAIGEANKFWEHGNEPAFTIIPNFLFSGVAAILVSIIIIVWSLFYIDKKHGPLIYLMLFIILLLVGGGVGQVIFFTVCYAFATRINKPLLWWKRVLPKAVYVVLSKLWLIFLFLSSVLLLFSLEIAIFGFIPGITNPDIIVNIMLLSLVCSLIFLIFSFISGFAYEIERGQE